MGFMGRIVWFGLVSAGAPASVVVAGTAAVVGGTAYMAYKAGQKSKRKKRK